MTNYRILFTTTPTTDLAQRIATALVEGRLAACVNIVDSVKSIYRWQGVVEQTSECLLLIKTAEDKIAAVEAAIRELHTYDLPECIVLPILSGSEAYLAWLGEALN